MAGIVESYKKIFENKKMQAGLFIIAVLWAVCSTMLDIATDKPENFGQNIIDIMFEIFVGAYSLQFLHNAIHNINNSVLPSFKEIKSNIYWDMIRLNIVWTFYAVIIITAVVIIYLTTIHNLIFPVITCVIIAFIAMFAYYIYLAYAENLVPKGLFNIAIVFKFIKPAFKDTIIKTCLFILITLLALIICILIYAAAAITGFDTIGFVGKDYYMLDFAVISCAIYFIILTWYLAFPYSLINTYKEKIRPLLRKDDTNGENV